MSPLLPLAAEAGDYSLQTGGARVISGHRRGHDYLDARPEPFRRLRHRGLALAMTEEAAPQPAQRHRDHRHRPALENLLHSLLELAHLPVARELALGKDAHHLAVGELRI